MVTLASYVTCSLWMTVSEEIVLLFFFKGDEIEFPRATRGQGWMAVSKKSSGFLDTGRLGGPPLFRVPLAFIPGFVSHQWYVLFISIYTFHIVGGRGIKACDWIQKRRKKTKKKKKLKREITCSFHQPWIHCSMAEAQCLCRVRFSGGMKKVYVTGEKHVFVSEQMLHVPHTSCALYIYIYLTSGWFIIIISIVSFTVIWTYMYTTFQGYKQWCFSFRWYI